LINKAKHEMIG